MSTRDRLSVASAVAVLLSCAALLPVFDGAGWVVRVAGAVLVVAVCSSGARALRAPRGLHLVAGLLGLAAYVTVVFAGATLAVGVLPTGDTLRSLGDTIGEGLLDVEELAPPVPTSPGLVLLAVLGAGGIALLVDTLAVTLRQAALAGLPLLLLFAVPSAVLADGLGVVPFLAGAAGWMGLLLADAGDTVRQWGTPLQRRTGAAADPGLGRVGRRIGVAALGVAVVVPALVPGLQARLVGGGSGDGFGGGSRRVDTYNPITRLAGQLSLPERQELLRYTSEDDTPGYLRLTTLDSFDEDGGWSSSELSGDPDEDRAQDGIGAPEGLTRAASSLTKVSLQMTGDLDGPWLPLPFPPQDVDVDGPWLWDAEAGTVFTTRTSLGELDEPYSVRALVVEPTVEQLRAGGSVPTGISETYAQQPELSPFVQAELDRVTGDRDTAYDRVAALQAYFTGEGFRYDDSASAPGINSPDALENFLRGRVGFCEQYASAMAAMVRGLGLPARVAIGFTPGNQGSDGDYVVTTDEAHAWPEVWFAGSGWVRFEPTPRADGQTTRPDYSEAPAPVGQGPAPSAAPSAAPSTAPLLPGETLPGDRAGADGATGRAAQDGAGGPSPWLLLGPAGLLLLAAPSLLARLRARRRWRAPSPAIAWAALQDDAVDVGHRWRPADSPRAAAAHLLTAVALPPAAAQALGRLASAAERSRYARPGSQGLSSDRPPHGLGASGLRTEALRSDVAAVRSGLLASASGRTRWTARLASPSTLRWASSTTGAATADALDRVDRLVGAVGARLRPRAGRST